MQMEGEQLSSEAAQALKQAVEGRPELAEQMKKLRPDEYREILAEATKIGVLKAESSPIVCSSVKDAIKHIEGGAVSLE
jgi:hypothetical protein